MSNFDNKLRQSPNYVRLDPKPIYGPRQSGWVILPEETHPLAKAEIDPLFWTWPADKILRVFQLLGVTFQR